MQITDKKELLEKVKQNGSALYYASDELKLFFKKTLDN
jgi:hypothetical protein